MKDYEPGCPECGEYAYYYCDNDATPEWNCLVFCGNYGWDNEIIRNDPYLLKPETRENLKMYELYVKPNRYK